MRGRGECVLVGARADGARGADHADAAVAGAADGGAHRGLDDLDDGDAVAVRVPLARVAEHGRRGGVAGDDEQLHALGDEVVDHLEGVRADLGERLRPVGRVAVSPT